jgi:hypothetical protein
MTQCTEPAKRRRSHWQRALGGALVAMLLLPVPALAITWVNDWQLVTKNNVTTFGTPSGANQLNWFFFQPVDPPPPGQVVTISVTRDFMPAGGNPSLSAQVLLDNLKVPGNSTTGFHMQIWTTDTSGLNEADIIGTSSNPNAAVAFGDPPNNSNQFGTGPNLNSDTTYRLHVIFNIDPGWSYQASSSTHQIVTTFND